MAELVTFGDTSLRLAPAGAGRLETAEDVRMRVSGTESNVAVAASNLGADALWLSKLPDSPLGHRVETELRRHGIETEVAWSDEGRQSLQFYEQGVEPRERRRLQDRSGAAVASVEPGELPMNRVQEADAVFVAGSTLALSGQVLETAQAVMRAGAGGGIVAMDLDFRPGLWSVEAARETLLPVFDSVDVLFADEEQARTVFERTGKPRQMAHAIASEHDFEMVVITRSERGALAWHDNVIHERDGREVEAVDPTGQHEAFIGAFLERVLDGASPDTALSTGVATAMLARTTPGAMVTTTPEEVEALADDLGPVR